MLDSPASVAVICIAANCVLPVAIAITSAKRLARASRLRFGLGPLVLFVAALGSIVGLMAISYSFSFLYCGWPFWLTAATLVRREWQDSGTLDCNDVVFGALVGTVLQFLCTLLLFGVLTNWEFSFLPRHS